MSGGREGETGERRGAFPLRAADITIHLNRSSPETTIRHFQFLWAIKRPVVQLPFHVKTYILATIINRIKLLRLLIKKKINAFFPFSTNVLIFKFPIHIAYSIHFLNTKSFER